jgi:hypothetical protein
MSDPWAEVEEWARGKREQQAQEKRSQDTDERFTNLESKLDTLADGMTKLVESSSKTAPGAEEEDGGAAPNGEGERTPAPAPPPPAVPELPVETVTRGSIPRIYSGDDEPAEVEYIDGPSGETRKRPGRRKGHPTNIIVEAYEPPHIEGEEATA